MDPPAPMGTTEGSVVCHGGSSIASSDTDSEKHQSRESGDKEVHPNATGTHLHINDAEQFMAPQYVPISLKTGSKKAKKGKAATTPGSVAVSGRPNQPQRKLGDLKTKSIPGSVAISGRPRQRQRKLGDLKTKQVLEENRMEGIHDFSPYQPDRDDAELLDTNVESPRHSASEARMRDSVLRPQNVAQVAPMPPTSALVPPEPNPALPVPSPDVDIHIDINIDTSRLPPAVDLVEANPVTQYPDLPFAEPMNNDEERRHNKESRRYYRRAGLIFLPLVIILVSCALGLFFLLRPDKEEDKDEVKNEPGTEEMMTPEAKMLSLLPEETIVVIDLDDDIIIAPSAQTLAYRWIRDDPLLVNYSEGNDWRLVQRFALSTLFFATGGESLWGNNDNWLSYTVHEEDWYSISSIDSSIWEYGSLNPYEVYVEPSEELSHIWLFNNGLRGTIPPEFYLLTSLRTIDMVSNPLLSGTISSQIGTLKRLETLGLGMTGISGQLPSEIGLLQSIMSFQIFNAQLQGTIPTEIGMLPTLWLLLLDSNMLTGTIPTELGLNTELLFLGLFENLLSSTIPTELRFNTNLLFLALFDNLLTSTIPTELGQITALNDLDIASNSFTGTLPSELGGILIPIEDRARATYRDKIEEMFPGLGFLAEFEFERILGDQDIQVDNNLLTGTLPTELGQLSDMQYFTVSYNSFSGSIPTFLGSDFTRLWWLDLSNNLFSGTVPTNLGQLTALTRFAAHNNSLTGTLPLELCWIQDGFDCQQSDLLLCPICDE